MERSTQTVDVIVLGTGAAGLTAALAAHGHGASVQVFEQGTHIGGTIGPGMVFGFAAGRDAASRLG